MGINGAYPLLREKGVIRKPVEFKSPDDGKIYVDVFGSFYSKLMKENWVAFGHWLKKILPDQEKYILVIDGLPSYEKSLAHNKRDEKKKRELEKTESILWSASKSGRLSKSKWKKIKSLLARTIKKYLVDILNELGFTCLMAQGEADVFIGSVQGPTTVMSSDSDLIFYANVNQWLIPKFVKNKLCVSTVSKGDVLSKLQLTPTTLSALAIVSGNDYSSNVRGFGIRKCLKMVLDLRESVDVQCILNDFQDLFEEGQVDKDQFANALSIYWFQKETFNQVDEGHLALLEKRVHLLSKVQQLKDARQSKRDEKGAKDNLVLPRLSNINLSSQVSQKGTNNRYSYLEVDLSKKREDDPPLPPAKLKKRSQ